MDNKVRTPEGVRQCTGMLAEVLRQERTDNLRGNILAARQDHAEAASILSEGRNAICSVIMSNRGGVTGVHGFIGERAQVYIANALSTVEGNGTHYRLLDDNGPVDYLRDNIPIQQKAYNPGNKLGLPPVGVHSKMYPDFVQNGGIYHVPRDGHAKYLRYLGIDKEAAGKLRKTELRMWRNVHKFAEEHPEVKLEPMLVSYDEIQAGAIEDTLDSFEKRLDEKRDARINKAVKDSKATVREGFRVTAFSSILEGGADGLVCIANKKRNGKPVSEFSRADWHDVGLTTAKGTGKGAARGAATYLLVNGAKVPWPIASAGLTTSFRIAEDVWEYRTDQSNREELRGRIGKHIVEGAVSGGSTLAAMSLCALIVSPFTPQGKVIRICTGLAGSYIGTKALSAVKDYLN